MGAVYDVVSADTRPLGEVADIFRGYGRKVVRQATSIQKKSLDFVPILAGHNIGAGKFTCWSLDLEVHEWADPGHKVFRGERSEKLSRMLNKKVMCKRLVSSDVKVDAALDASEGRQPYMTFDTVTNVVPKDATFTSEFLLGVLNSTLMTVYLRDIVFCRSTLTMDLDAPYLGQLPIKTPPEGLRSEIGQTAIEVQEMTQSIADESKSGGESAILRTRLRQREALTRALDDKVFEAYGVLEQAELFRDLRSI
jgi:hypothetical protein